MIDAGADRPASGETMASRSCKAIVTPEKGKCFLNSERGSGMVEFPDFISLFHTDASIAGGCSTGVINSFSRVSRRNVFAVSATNGPVREG